MQPVKYDVSQPLKTYELHDCDLGKQQHIDLWMSIIKLRSNNVESLVNVAYIQRLCRVLWLFTVVAC